MPELPELEVVKDVLHRRVVGATIEVVEVLPPGGPVVVRDLTPFGFGQALMGATITAVKWQISNGKCQDGSGFAICHLTFDVFHKRPQLTAEETDRLYAAMRTTLANAVDRVRIEMADAIHLKPRDFLSVHMKSGQPCPRCGSPLFSQGGGSPISVVSANQRITNFCRACQPGGLIRGL